MKKTRFSEEQIIAVLHEAAASANAREICRKYGITETTFYRWRAKDGRLRVSKAKRLKAAAEEDRRLKQLVANLALVNAMLKDVLGRTG